MNIQVDLPYIRLGGTQEDKFTSEEVRCEDDGYNWRRKWVVGKRGETFQRHAEKAGGGDNRALLETPKRIKLTPSAALALRGYEWARFLVNRKSYWARLPGGNRDIDGVYRLVQTSEAEALRKEGK